MEGTKTFFITPELSIMPEDFLPNFFLRGFEGYYLMDDPYLDIQSKVDVLFSLFPELILFFNIERRLHGIDWPYFINGLKEKYGSRATIGVIHNRDTDEAEKRRLERMYLYDIGISGGCILIGYRKAYNLMLLISVLAANQANGRRKNLRSICPPSCSFNFTKAGRRYAGTVNDVSISHFSCVFEGPEPDLLEYEKCRDIQLNLSGIICTVDAVMLMRRTIADSSLHVFTFRNSKDLDGLDPDVLAKMNGFIQTQYLRNVMGLVKSGFDERIRGRRQIA